MILHNSDKTNFHFFILASLFSLIFCLFNKGSFVYFMQIKIQQKKFTRSNHFDMFKICIYNLVVKHKGRQEKQAVCFSQSVSNFYHNHNERQLRNLFGKPDWKLRSIVELLESIRVSFLHCSSRN